MGGPVASSSKRPREVMCIFLSVVVHSAYIFQEPDTAHKRRVRHQAVETDHGEEVEELQRVYHNISDSDSDSDSGSGSGSDTDVSAAPSVEV